MSRPSAARLAVGGEVCRVRRSAAGRSSLPALSAKKDPPVPQNEKVLTRFSQVGAPPCRIRLSVHKQTLPIATDHLHSAPEFQMWIKIIRTPNTADRKKIQL